MPDISNARCLQPCQRPLWSAPLLLASLPTSVDQRLINSVAQIPVGGNCSELVRVVVVGFTEVSKLLLKSVRSVLSNPLDSREALTPHPDEGELL